MARICRWVMIIGVVGILSGGIPLGERPAQAGMEGEKREGSEASGSADFKACVKLALHQSPHFTQSAIEIERQHLDESDSRWALAPYFYFRTGLKIVENESDQEDLADYTVSITTRDYNPFRSFFDLKAEQIMTKIAVLRHKMVISDGIRSLAQMLLHMENLDRMAADQDRLVTLAAERLDFVRQRQKLGHATQLDVRIAEQELAIARSERERIATTRASVRESFEYFLGLDKTQKLDLDLEGARRQIKGDFDPLPVTLEQVHASDFELKIAELRKEAQEHNITVAYTRYLPSLSLGFKTPELWQDEDDYDYFVALRATLPIWEGFSRGRNVERQRKILRQREVRYAIMENNLSHRWHNARRDLQDAEMALKLAQTDEELARLKEKQGEILYRSNQQTLPALITLREERLMAQKKTLMKEKARDLQLLELRFLSGHLFNGLVTVAPGEER